MEHNEIEKILLGFNDPNLPEIFHFEDTPSAIEFQKIYDFYSVTLKNFSDYGFAPALIYFNNRLDQNAFACKRGGYSIVSFNAGTIIHLNNTFNTIKFETKNSHLDSFLDTNVNKLMYQFCLHFTLYHEMAHLVQNSSYLLRGLHELHKSNEKYDEQRHLLEFDADQFSSLCLGTHICDYLERIDPLDQNPELTEHVINIATAALIVYILSFNSANKAIYFDKFHHPHPSIRLSLIVQTLLDYTYDSRKSRPANGMEKTKFVIDAGNIVQNGTKSDIVISYVKILMSNYGEIKKYIDGFTLINNKKISLATDKWNEMAK